MGKIDGTCRVRSRSTRRLPFAFAVGLAISAAFHPVAIAAQLKDIRVGKHPTFIRIVLDTDAPTTHEVEDQDGNLYVRVYGLEAKNQTRLIDAPYAPLKQVALQESPDGSILLKFDSEAPFAIKAFHLKPDGPAPNRLVIDLHATQRVAITRTETTKAKRVKLRFDAARND